MKKFFADDVLIFLRIYMRENPILVLTIAGSDPSGGAGIQADIRAFEATGVYGFSAITAITVQTAAKVIKWSPVEANLVRDQVFTILEEYPVKYVKCGMLPTSAIVDVVVDAKAKFGFTLIVDPILASGTNAGSAENSDDGKGVPLVQSEMKEYFISKLFPVTDIIVPNASEATNFTGISIAEMLDVIKVGQKFEEWGIPNMILKGGHINPEDSEIIDYLYMEGGVEFFTRSRILNGTATHGTGCIFSAMFTAQLALTDDIFIALNNTENQLELDFRNLLSLPSNNATEGNSGAKVVDKGISPKEREILEEVMEVYRYVHKQPLLADFVAEVRMNISICTERAKSKEDVAAVEGRITVVNSLPYAAGPFKMGVANHTARLVLTAHEKDPSIRAVMNLKYMPEFLPKLAEEGFYLFQINRESQDNKVENNTMQWIINESYKIANKMPDIIWDCGEPEKEPMLRLFAKDSHDLIDKLKGILRAYRKFRS